MRKDEVEILRSFDLIVPVPGLSLSEKLRLCNAFDGYEIVKGIHDMIVIDTLQFDSNKFTLKVSLRKPLTYKEIDEFLKNLFGFVYEVTRIQIDTKDIAVNWNLTEYGRPSVFFNKELFQFDPRRQTVFSEFKDVREKELPTEKKYHLKEGCSYLVDGQDKAFEVFSDEVHHGIQGLLITRTFPEKMKEEFDLKKTPIFWLTQNKGERCIHPQDLVELSHIVREFVESGNRGIILLHGTEYLISQNQFDHILKLFQTINDNIAGTSIALLAPFNKNTLSPDECSRLETEFLKL